MSCVFKPYNPSPILPSLGIREACWLIGVNTILTRSMVRCPRLSLGKVSLLGKDRFCRPVKVNLNSQFPHHPLAFYCLPVYHCDAINTATRKLILPNKESISKCVLGEFSKSQFRDFVKFPGLNPGPRFDRFVRPARFRKRRPENFR